MRKKLIIIVIAVAVVAAGAFYFVNSSPSPVPVIGGTLPAQDVADIQRAVRRKMWSDTFTNLSVKGLKNIPAALKKDFKDHVVTITIEHIPPLFNSSDYLAKMSLGSTGNTTFYYAVRRTTNGWEVYGTSIVTMTALPAAVPAGMVVPKRGD